jgi:hypothetical protein
MPRGGWVYILNNRPFGILRRSDSSLPDWLGGTQLDKFMECGRRRSNRPKLRQEAGMIVENYALCDALLFLHSVLLIGGPIVLFRRGWPIAGGLVSLAATILPIAGQTWFTDSESPGLGLLFMVEVPCAFAILVAGVCLTTARLIRRLRTLLT